MRLDTTQKAEVIRKSPSSPTQPVEEEKAWMMSLTMVIRTAETGPNIKAASRLTAPLRSTLRKGGMKGRGNSKNMTTVAMAANMAL